jgi:hypothetical protein
MGACSDGTDIVCGDLRKSSSSCPREKRFRIPGCSETICLGSFPEACGVGCPGSLCEGLDRGDGYTNVMCRTDGGAPDR